MPKPLSRRKLLKAGLAAAAGVSAAGGAAYLAGKNGLIPPDHGGIYGVGETLTYASQRLLMSRHSLAREFDRSQISKVFSGQWRPARHPTYRRLLGEISQTGGWRSTAWSRARRPSLADLKRYPSRSQITHQACEEGWSSIAEWTGVPLSHVLNLVGSASASEVCGLFLRSRRLVGQHRYGRRDASADAAGLRHEWPELPTGHGAPLRLRVPRQLGYKSVKYIARITVTDT